MRLGRCLGGRRDGTEGHARLSREWYTGRRIEWIYSVSDLIKHWDLLVKIRRRVVGLIGVVGVWKLRKDFMFERRGSDLLHFCVGSFSVNEVDPTVTGIFEDLFLDRNLGNRVGLSFQFVDVTFIILFPVVLNGGAKVCRKYIYYARIQFMF